MRAVVSRDGARSGNTNVRPRRALSGRSLRHARSVKTDDANDTKSSPIHHPNRIQPACGSATMWLTNNAVEAPTTMGSRTRTMASNRARAGCACHCRLDCDSARDDTHPPVLFRRLIGAEWLHRRIPNRPGEPGRVADRTITRTKRPPIGGMSVQSSSQGTQRRSWLPITAPVRRYVYGHPAWPGGALRRKRSCSAAELIAKRVGCSRDAAIELLSERAVEVTRTIPDAARLVIAGALRFEPRS